MHDIYQHAYKLTNFPHDSLITNVIQIDEKIIFVELIIRKYDLLLIIVIQTLTE